MYFQIVRAFVANDARTHHYLFWAHDFCFKFDKEFNLYTVLICIYVINQITHRAVLKIRIRV